MNTINALHRIATPPMNDPQIEILENKVFNLAIEGDEEAARRYADLYLCRLHWEGTRSAQHRQDFVDQAQRAHGWLARHSQADTTRGFPKWLASVVLTFLGRSFKKRGSRGTLSEGIWPWSPRRGFRL